MQRKELLAAIKPNIAPPHSDKFSRNLYNWQRQKGGHYNRVLCAQIVCPGADHNYRPFNYEHGRPDLFFGWLPGDGWVCGTRVATILSGVQKQAFAHPTAWDWVDVTDWFWREYLRIGRCFLHPDHERCIMNGEARWRYYGNTERECLWCGRHEHLTTETHVKHVWRSEIQWIAPEAP